MGAFIDLTGQRFGRLVVLKRVYRNGIRGTFWLCQCDCGKQKAIIASSLRGGFSRSCGCLQKERTPRTHCMTHTRLYNIWGKMLDRTRNPRNPRYNDYGGRGIHTCSEWIHFESFMQWSLSHGYTDNLTLDRIDVDGDYEPSNCRFITLEEQQGNKRNTIRLTIDGETKTLVEWCDIYNSTYTKAYKRYRRGQSPQDIFKEGYSLPF